MHKRAGLSRGGPSAISGGGASEAVARLGDGTAGQGTPRGYGTSGVGWTTVSVEEEVVVVVGAGTLVAWEGVCGS